MRYYLWLGDQALSGLTYAWPVSLLVLALLLAAVIADVSRQRFSVGVRSFCLFLPLVGTCLVLASGALLEKKQHLFFLPYVGLGACVVLSGIAVFQNRKMWMTASAISLCVLWYSLWCGFVSVMSITGDWL
jgi:hypothetical protein